MKGPMRKNGHVDGRDRCKIIDELSRKLYRSDVLETSVFCMNVSSSSAVLSKDPQVGR